MFSLFTLSLSQFCYLVLSSSLFLHVFPLSLHLFLFHSLPFFAISLSFHFASYLSLYLSVSHYLFLTLPFLIAPSLSLSPSFPLYLALSHSFSYEEDESDGLICFRSLHQFISRFNRSSLKSWQSISLRPKMRRWSKKISFLNFNLVWSVQRVKMWQGGF